MEKIYGGCGRGLRRRITTLRGEVASATEPGRVTTDG